MNSLVRLTPTIATVVLSLGSFTLAGCGGGASAPDRVSATGTITIDGKPVEGLQVLFSPKPSGRPCVGETDSSGYYSMVYRADAPGVPPGEYAVTIQEQNLESENDDGESITKESIIPPEFRFGMTTVEVTADGLEKDFDIQSAAAPAE